MHPQGQTSRGEQLSQDQDLHLQYETLIPFAYLLSTFLSISAWEDNTFIRISQTTAPAGNFIAGFVVPNHNQCMKGETPSFILQGISLGSQMPLYAYIVLQVPFVKLKH